MPPPSSQRRVDLLEEDIDTLVDICHQRQREYSQLKRGEKGPFWEHVQEDVYRQTGKEFRNCNQRMASLAKQRANAVRSLLGRGLADKPNEREKQLNLWNTGLDKEDQQETARRAEKEVQQQEQRLNLQLQTESVQRFSD